MNSGTGPIPWMTCWMRRSSSRCGMKMKLGPWKPEPDLQARSPYPLCLRLRLGNHGKAVVGQAYSASSIGATAHWADRLFRLTSALTKLPPLAVVRASPKSEIWTLAPKRRKGGIDSHAHRGAVVTAPAHRTRQECRPGVRLYLPILLAFLNANQQKFCTV